MLGFTAEAAAIDWVKTRPVELAIVGLKLKRADGLDVLAALKEINPRLDVCVLTAYPSLEAAQAALARGARAFWLTPTVADEMGGEGKTSYGHASSRGVMEKLAPSPVGARDSEK